MILLAAMAISLVNERYLYLGLPIRIRYTIDCVYRLAGWSPWQTPITRSELVHDLLNTLLFDSTQLLFSSLLIATPAVLWLRLRQPRPSLRDLTRQPGLVACGAALLGYLLYVDLYHYFSTRRLYLRCTVGSAVVVAWLIQALSCRWQAEACWVDRLGRLIGLGWLVTMLGELGLAVF